MNMFMQTQRQLIHTAIAKLPAFVMSPVTLRDASAIPPHTAPAMYAYAFEQAQRIVALQQPRRTFESFHLN